MPMKSSQPGKACCHAEAPRRLIDTRRHSIHARYIGTFLNKGENELVGLNEYDLHRDLESSIEQATLRTHIRDSHLHD